MIVSAQHEFVFCHVPRTAGRSITQILVKKLGGLYSPPLHSTRIPVKALDYRRIMVVREPLERLLSLWWAECQDPETSRKSILQGDGLWAFVAKALGGPRDEYQTQSQFHEMLGMPESVLVLKYEDLPGCLEEIPGFESRYIRLLPHLNGGSLPRQRIVVDSLIKEYLEADYENFDYLQIRNTT